MRRSPTRFKINVLKRLHDDDEPSVREALKGQAARKWREQTKPVLHTKRVLLCKRDEHGMVSRHKARLVVCDNEMRDYQEDTLSPVVDFTVAKLIICLSL